MDTQGSSPDIRFQPSDGFCLNPNQELYWDAEALGKELVRSFELCHSCRMCFKYCESFPTLFAAVDRHGGVVNVPAATVDKIVDECFRCKLCDTQCPYTDKEKHPFRLDFPRLMLRAKAVNRKRTGIPLRDRMLAAPDLLFETRDTMLYQVHEMLHAEGSWERPGAIEDELEAYNPIVPAGGELSATLMLEYDTEEERTVRLQELLGLDAHLWLHVGGAPPVAVRFDHAQVSPTRISSVCSTSSGRSPSSKRGWSRPRVLSCGWWSITPSCARRRSFPRRPAGSWPPTLPKRGHPPPQIKGAGW